ncbi:unnamed protein product, partial [marine sediment metagenome]
DKPIQQMRLKVGGLNHFTFLLGLEDLSSNQSLMPKFNKKALPFFKENEERFEFSSLTFEIFRRFGYFSYAGDNHIGEYLQFGEEFTKSQDMVDWIDLMDKEGKTMYRRFIDNYELLKNKKSPKNRILWDR